MQTPSHLNTRRKHLPRLRKARALFAAALGLGSAAALPHAQALTINLPLINVTLFGDLGGSQPCAPVQGPGGLLYGVTTTGGANGTGVLYKASLDGTNVVNLHTFAALNLLAANSDGANPKAELCVGIDGKLYGTTCNGGPAGTGTIFRVNADGTGFTVLHAFPASLLGLNSGGANPCAGLVAGLDGYLYGTACNGGNKGCGTVFRLALNGGGFTTLHHFTGGADGANPLAALCVGANGALYGSAKLGGANGLGVAFRLLADGSLATLHAFAGPEGSHPLAALTLGKDGNLYGVTADGGASGLGAAFGVSTDGAQFAPLASFNATVGANPAVKLTVGADGDLLGTTASGGANGSGTIVDLALDGTLTPLLSFPAGDANPTSLTVDAGGLLHAAVDVGGVASLVSAALPPVINSALTLNGTLGLPLTYQISASGAPTTFTATGLPAGLSVDATTGLISGTPTVPGTTTVTIGASSLLGADSQPLTIKILAQGPGLTVTALPGAQIGVPYNFQVTANGNPTEFSATGLPTGLSINPTTGLILGTPTQAGDFTVTLTAIGAGGINTGSYPLSVLPAVPVITSAAGANAQLGQPFAYGITATGNPTGFTANGLPAGLTLDAASGSITGTPTQLGVFPVALTATNAAGTASGSLTLTVTAEASVTPVIMSPASASAQVGVPFSYGVEASGDVTSYDATGLPAGLSIDPSTGLISGTPTQAGTFPVTLWATGAQGSGSATMTLNVSGTAPLPAPPSITSATQADLEVGTPFSYQITASNDPTSFGATGLPDGLSVDPATGLISGTPKLAGNFSFVVSASNAGGTGLGTVSAQASSKLPVITIQALGSDVIADSGVLGKFMLTRTGDVSQELLVSYAVKGDAIPDVDYAKRRGLKRFKAGHANAYVSIEAFGDLAGADRKKVKLVLQPGVNYTVGAAKKAKMWLEAQ